jgi:3-hydroxyanthranilate 3,4-dioxygenase
MAIGTPFNLKKWIEEHRHLLKPPVGNQQVYRDNQDFIVMVVGGPNARKDFHQEEGEELFYQLEGDIVIRIMEDGHPKDIEVKEGELFLLPAGVPHSPQRPANSVGLVIERYRRTGEKDAFSWFCESCHHLLYREELDLKDIVGQLPPLLDRFWSNPDARTCKKCGSVLEK